MKKLIAILFTLSLFLVFLFNNAYAEETNKPVEYTCGVYKYILNTDGTACITGYNGKEDTLELPAELDGKIVTVIGDYAFEHSDLTSIRIPNSTIMIGANPFKSCSSLKSIVVSPKHPTLAVIDGVLFSKPDKRLVCYPENLPGESYNIPNGIKIIGNYAFYFCKNITSLVIPDSVFSIGENAFDYCQSLTSVTIPDSVTEIGDYAFSGCGGLTSVAIPDGVTEIGNGVFYDCDSLSSVSIPGSVTNIGNEAFAKCISLSSITIPDSVTAIGDRAFANCRSLDSITIPASVTYIGSVPFEGHSPGITISPDNNSYCYIDGALFSKSDKRLIHYKYGSSVDIPNGIRIIGDNVFSERMDITSVSIPNSVSEIGNNAFSACTALTSLTIPGSVAVIGDNAFSWCTNLSDVTISDGVAVIGKNAFGTCWSIPSITIPDSVTTIGDEAFARDSFENIAIPGSVTEIGINPFINSSVQTISVSSDNTSFYSIDDVLFSKADNRLIAYPRFKTDTSYIIPNGIQRIGNSAFAYCGYLTDITIPEGVISIGNSAFSCTSLTSVTIPDSVTEIGDYAFNWTNLTSVTIPDSVTKIGNDAFGETHNVVLVVSRGSYAEQYAIENGIPYNWSDEQDLSWLLEDDNL